MTTIFKAFFGIVIAALLLSTAPSYAGTTLIDNDSSFDVTYVRLVLNVPRPDTEYIEGAVTIRSIARDIAQDNRIQFNLTSNLSVDSVSNDGKPIRFLHVGDSLFVTLGTHFAPTTVFDVTIHYHGFSRTGAFLHTLQGEPQSPPILWTASEAYGSKDWWPCKDNPADKIDSADIIVTCPEGFTIASNGLLRSVVDHDTSHTFWWHESYPIDHYLIAFACTDYDTTGHWHHWADGDSTLIESYVFPTSKATISVQLLEVDSLLDEYESWFGPYPFRREKYGIAQWHGGGMENETLSFCNNADPALVAHETAHQWFGDAVTCKTWNDCWLNEGFATYVNDLHFGQKFGQKFFDTVMTNTEADVTSQPGGSVHTPDSLLLVHVLNPRLVYSKGALVLNMLRYVLGSDTAFFRAIREYVTGPLRYGVAGTEDLRMSVEKSSGMNLKWFFDQWVYDEGYPIYNVAWNPTDALHPAVAISQTGSVPWSPFFRMPIELEFRGPNIDTIVQVMNDKPLQPFAFDFTKPVTSMIFDPHNWILDGSGSRTLAVQSTESVTSGLTVTRSIGRYIISFGLADASDVSVEICDVLGRQITRIDEGVLDVGQHSIPLAISLPPGEYFFRLHDGKSARITRFLSVN